MKDNKREPLLERWAKQYIEEDGRRLSEEAKQLEEHSPAPLPRLDGRVRSFLSSRRRGRYVAAFGAMAAGLLLIFLLPRLGPLSSDTVQDALQDAAFMTQSVIDEPPLLYDADEPAVGGAMEEAVPLDVGAESPLSPAAAVPLPAEAGSAAAPQALDGAAPGSVDAAALAPNASAPTMVEEAEEMDAFADSEEAAPSSNVILLSFTLPDGYSVDSVREDRGETIYHLANEALDDVVLSVSDASQFPAPGTAALTPVRAGSGDTAYGQSRPDAQFLTFERDGLRYRLTCQHDMQTLLSLWQHIISA